MATFDEDANAMNDLSQVILGEPMDVAIALTNPSREQNGRLIQDALMTQGTDVTLRKMLVEVARSRLAKSQPAHAHASLVEETLTAAALLGSSTEIGRIVESMNDPRFCNWLATGRFE